MTKGLIGLEYKKNQKKCPVAAVCSALGTALLILINCNLPAAYRTKSISLSCLYSNQWKYGAGDSNRKSGLY